jgi:hypothetical protein
MSSRTIAFALLVAASAALAGAGAVEVSRRGLWFRGDFESGGLEGWYWDRARPDSIRVVSQPVRKGRYAVGITLAPGDRAAGKERAELKLGDKEIERLRGRQGGEMWYAWSLFLPAGEAEPPGEPLQIVAQWHHRPPQPPASEKSGKSTETVLGLRPEVNGPPPLTLHLVSKAGQRSLVLFGRSAARGERRVLGERPARTGAWMDLLFHIRWSTGGDGFVEAWLDGQSLTSGRKLGATLYSPDSNYLRLGLYRGKGASTTNRVYLDEIRIGESRQAVAP